LKGQFSGNIIHINQTLQTSSSVYRMDTNKLHVLRNIWL